MPGGSGKTRRCLIFSSAKTRPRRDGAEVPRHETAVEQGTEAVEVQRAVALREDEEGNSCRRSDVRGQALGGQKGRTLPVEGHLTAPPAYQGRGTGAGTIFPLRAGPYCVGCP